MGIILLIYVNQTTLKHKSTSLVSPDSTLLYITSPPPTAIKDKRVVDLCILLSFDSLSPYQYINIYQYISIYQSYSLIDTDLPS